MKGMEGSTDLPIGRACITARVRQGRAERLILHPRDHGCYGVDALWSDLDRWRLQAREALQGGGELALALRWNVAAYLWYAGLCPDLAAAVERAQDLLSRGVGLGQLDALIRWRTEAG